MVIKNKKFNSTYPSVTIVTVVYNGENYIEETIKSVIGQSYNNFEYIIIDGNSTDNTTNIIKKYEDQIDFWITESDYGIYDAMNKAIRFAKGEWINFMNAGDSFVSPDILEKIFTVEKINTFDFIYGEHIWKNEMNTFQVKTRPLDLMWQRICFCHQSLFSKTILMKEKPFDLSYKIVCDYENYFSRYMEGKKFYECKFPISIFLAGGFSDVSFFTRTKERYSVVKKYKNDLEFKKYYLKLIAEYYLKKIKERFK